MSSKDHTIRFNPDDLPKIIEYAPPHPASRRVYVPRSTRAGRLLLCRPEFIVRDENDSSNK